MEVMNMGLRGQFGVVFRDEALTDRQKLAIECYQNAYNKVRVA